MATTAQRKLPPASCDVLIIGAGLSGMAAAHQLLAEDDGKHKLCVLEARDRSGGRLLTHQGFIDMGAAWSWPSDHVLRALCKALEGQKTVAQYASGDSVQVGPDGSLRRGHGRGGDNRVRFKLGGQGIVDAIVQTLPPDTLHLAVTVTRIDYSQTPARVYYETTLGTGSIEARRVIIAVPPQIVAYNIDIVPALPRSWVQALQTTPTWMEDTMKVAVEYKEPIWRTRGLSGAIYSSMGPVPVREMWDNSDISKNKFALAGFVMGADVQRAQQLSEEELKEEVLRQLDVVFQGQEHRVLVTGFHFQIWLSEPFTHVALPEARAQTAHVNPHYAFGKAILRTSVSNALFFAGTETEDEYGHMNGAVKAGLRVAAQVTKSLAHAQQTTHVEL